MNQQYAPITANLSTSKDPRILQLILFFGGIMGIVTGLLLNHWAPLIYCPPALYLGVSGFALLVLVSSWIFPAVKRQLGEFAFFSFVFFYLSIIFLGYVNQLSAGFALMLIMSQALFAVSFRNLTEFSIFAITSLGLFIICSLFAGELLVPPIIFLSLLAAVTVFAGIYIWLRETTFFQFRQNRLLQQDLLDSSIFAIFLLDANCKSVLYQNKIADGYILKLMGNTHIDSAKLFQFLGLDIDFITKRFQMADPDFQEKSYFTIRPRKEDERDFEIYISKIQSQNDINILIKFRDITQLKQQERKLSHSLSVNESLLNAFPDILITFNGKGIIQAVRASRDFPLLQPIEQFVGKHFSALSAEVMSATKQKESEELIEEARETHKVVQTEFLSIINHENRHFDLRLVNLPKENEMLAIIRDITDSKEVELALKQSEQNYREIFNAGTDGIIILHPQTLEQIDVNQIACEQLGYAKSELMGFKIMALCDNPGPSGFEAFIDQAINGITHILECTLICRDGTSLHTELTAKLAILGGEFRLILLVRDISERRYQEEALRQSEQKYRTLVEKMNEGLILTDNDETILFVNNRLCEILGMTREELLGNRSYEVIDGEGTSDLIQEKTLLRQKGISDQYEVQFKGKNGDPIWVLIAGAPYIDSNGDSIGTIAIVTDISSRKATEVKLKDKNNELDAFVYKASHDLKGPLASIIGVTNIARDDVTDQAAHRYFDMISKSTKRLDLILSELIDVTRINKAKLNLEPVNIQEMVEEIISSLKHLPMSERVDFQTDISLSNGIKSDKKLLTSILQNLIVNSINYQNPETAHPYIRISAREKFDKINFAIEDNGVGIPDKMKHKVFEMFYRGNTKSKGSGLGLYIVKNAVAKLHGNVELDSKDGQGTTFAIALPAGPVEH